MALFTVADIFSYIIAVEGLSNQLVALIERYHISPTVFLLAINIFFLFLGMIMDATPAMLIFGPVLLPLANQLGDRLHSFWDDHDLQPYDWVDHSSGRRVAFIESLSGISFERITKSEYFRLWPRFWSVSC